ncbi:MAG: EamA family transporter [Paramuribaculum sp.]|nr:EamA family transporter [Paramuribaculum sp.]
MENSQQSPGQDAANHAAQPQRPSTGKFIAGNTCILVASIFWGVNVSVTKALIPEWMTSESITAVRLVGGCVLFWIASLFMHCGKINRGDWKKLLLGGFIGLFGFIYLFVMSLRYANPIDVSIIMTLPPLFVILMGVMFLHRRPSGLEYAGIVVSFAGAAVVILAAGGSGDAGKDNLIGITLAILSCICYAFYLVILEGPSKTYRPVTMLRWVFLFAGLPALVLLAGFDKLPLMHTSEAVPWIEISFILLCPTFIAYFFGAACN